jgi:ATP-dependent DNA helicase RecQ
MSYREIDITLDNARFGSYDFLYLSPERLETQIFIERFKAMQVSLIIIDEAHCISQWGHDFRPSYARISSLRDLKPNVPFAAFTATANEKTQADIIDKLGLKNVKLHKASFNRPNIAYRVFHSNYKKARLLELCKSLKNSSGIVYCQTRRSVREINAMLSSEGMSCAMYHGGMNNEDRTSTMKSWMQGQIKVIIATIAFGMGIDKSDVRYVIHYEISDSIEGYFQEVGRGGRDQKKAIGFALYNEKDLDKLKESISVKFPKNSEISKLYSMLFQHFKVAYGDGKDQVVEINIQDFASIYKVSPLIVYHGLKILELNGDLALSESVFHPSKIKLIVGITELYNFEIQYPAFNKLTTYLTRKLPGVFDVYKRIDINQMSKTLKMSKTHLGKQLEQLNNYGLCDFIKASKEPTITFLRARAQNDTFLLHPSVYGIRKKNYEAQIESVIQFLVEENCRSQKLLSYFGETAEKCGNCDHCVKQINEDKEPSDLILKLLEKPTTIATIMNQTGFNEELIMKSLDYLQEEEKIEFHNDWIAIR